MTDNTPKGLADCANYIRSKGFQTDNFNDQNVVARHFIECRDIWKNQSYATLTYDQKVTAFEAAVHISWHNLWGYGGRASELVWHWNNTYESPAYWRPCGALTATFDDMTMAGTGSLEIQASANITFEDMGTG